MADWRRHSSVDLVWRGALVLSCLVHICVCVIGWMLISKAEKRADIRNAIRVTLIKPQPKHVSMPAVSRTASMTNSREQEQLFRKEPPPKQKQQKVAQKIKRQKPPPDKPKPVSVNKPVDRQILPTTNSREQVPPKRKQQAIVQKIKLKKSPPLPKPEVQNQTMLNASKLKQQIQRSPPEPAPKVFDKGQPDPLKKSVSSSTTKNESLSVTNPKNIIPFADLAKADTTTQQLQPSTEVATVHLLEVTEELQPVSGNQDSALSGEQERYLTILRERIDRYKKYPLMARKSRQQGVVLVEFKLSKEGTLQDCQLKKSCGYRLLDRAALQAVKAAAPFPEVPSKIELYMTSFIVPVRFVID